MKDFIRSHLPSYPTSMAIMFLAMAAIFYFIAAYGACWLFLIFCALFLATDCICDAIRSIGK